MKTRALRRLSLFTLLTLVFAQLSLSAYACSALLFGDGPSSATVIAADADCHGVSNAEPRDVQCAFHCQDAPTVPASVVPDLSPDLSLPPLIVEFGAAALPSASALQRDAALVMATAPPAPVRLCRFLI